jgi:hypothetical protein
MRTSSQPQAPENIVFNEQAGEVLQRIRGALAGIIEALPGDIRRPQELSRAMGIDKKLSWKISNVVQCPDPFEAAQHVPGHAAIRIFLDAARNRNVPSKLLDGVTDALSGFDQLIKRHAGDRASLEMMLSSCARRGRDRVDLEHRRSAYRANSYLWGIQAKAQMRTYFLHPSEQPNRFDTASIRGYLGMRRIRANVPWILHRAKIVDDDGVPRQPLNREPLDLSVTSAELPILRDYCTSPLPRLRRVADEPGLVEHEIIEGPVGDTAAMSCVFGESVRNVGPLYRNEHNDSVELAVRANLPCETLVFDQVVHRALFDHLDPKLAVYSELTGETPPLHSNRSRYPIPHYESVEHLGRGAAVLYAPDVPRYTELAEFVFERMGWKGGDFEVFRVKMAYPPIPTAVVVSIDLPEMPLS